LNEPDKSTTKAEIKDIEELANLNPFATSSEGFTT
jgi:hypothetical protein